MSDALKNLLKDGRFGTKTVKQLKEVKAYIENLEAEQEADMTAMEFELAFDTSHRTQSEELVYDVNNALVQKNYYTTPQKTTKIWQIDYSYDDDDRLQYKDTQLVSTGQTLRISYEYLDTPNVLKYKHRSWLT
jgi:hypothetical protein